MNEELVKRLREPCQYENCVLCKEAADAIEKLSVFADYVNSLREEGWYMERIKYGDGSATIQTMMLPEPPKEEV